MLNLLLPNNFLTTLNPMNIIVLTGAGISAESGISTFRDNGGLWDKYDIYEVATPEAWEKNPSLVIKFYNERRKQLYEVEPNFGHKELARWEEDFNVHIITQNVDDLHERAGSSAVLHLHGELKKSRSTGADEGIFDITGIELNLGNLSPKGHQLRPHIVWFGEAVPAMTEAEEITATADVLVVVGTSLNVYPAAGLLHSAPRGTPIYVVDPGTMEGLPMHVKHIKEKASTGLKKLTDILLRENIQ